MLSCSHCPQGSWTFCTVDNLSIYHETTGTYPLFCCGSIQGLSTGPLRVPRPYFERHRVGDCPHIISLHLQSALPVAIRVVHLSLTEYSYYLWCWRVNNCLACLPVPNPFASLSSSLRQPRCLCARDGCSLLYQIASVFCQTTRIAQWWLSAPLHWISLQPSESGRSGAFLFFFFFCLTCDGAHLASSSPSIKGVCVGAFFSEQAAVRAALTFCQRLPTYCL